MATDDRLRPMTGRAANGAPRGSTAVGGAAEPVRTTAPPVALYVHVPFCLSLCPYCDFVVYAGAAARGPGSRIPAFLDALHAELDLRADGLDERWGPPAAARVAARIRSPTGTSTPGPDSTSRPALETIYLGGGTPSLLPGDAVAELLAHVRSRFGIAAGAEVSLEANPGPDDRGDIATFVRAGVNRLSYGVQSLDPVELRRLGRRHRPADVAAAVDDARAAGVGSISLDLLYDVPESSLATWEASLEGALALEPDHLSLYALTLDDPEAEGLTGDSGDHLPTTTGARRWREGARRSQDEEIAADQYRLAVERLGAAGWRGYEISNWARPGHESRHNLVYWQRRPYEAVGPGAHAFDGLTRRWNAARLDRYTAALSPAGAERPRLPPGDSELLDERQAAAEAMILGLRMDGGVPLADAQQEPLAGELEWAVATGLLAITAERLVLTTTGRLLSNELFARLV